MSNFLVCKLYSLEYYFLSRPNLPSPIDNTMSKEMLPEKLSGDQGLGPESPPIVKETNKGKRERLIVVFLMAVGIGTLVLASIFLLPYVNSLGGSILGGTSSNTDSGSAALKTTAAMASSFEARDAEGKLIHVSNGVARSGQITISGYSDSGYSTKLRCSIDTLPVYCDGSPITVTGLPHGKHKFSIAETGSVETVVRVFNWENIR